MISTKRRVPNGRDPLPWSEAAKAVFLSIVRTFWLLVHRRIHQPSKHLGMQLDFANGTSAGVYRETVVCESSTEDPCVLLVEFRLRGMHGWLHIIFRWESLLNIPLFVGFPGYMSKLWLGNDQHDVYRGVYEWDGPERATYYARCLWPVLALGSVPDSIHYCVVPGLHRDDLLRNPHLLDTVAPDDSNEWWRLVGIN